MSFSLVIALFFLVINIGPVNGLNRFNLISVKGHQRLDWKKTKGLVSKSRSLHTLGATEQFSPQVTVETIEAMIGVTATLLVACTVWWTSVIPQKRSELALSKRRGSVRKYLDELRDDESEDSSKKMQRWLFSDWLQKDSGPKDAALPFLKKAKWNSGDNPILVAFAGIFALVISASLLERATGNS